MGSVLTDDDGYLMSTGKERRSRLKQDHDKAQSADEKRLRQLMEEIQGVQMNLPEYENALDYKEFNTLRDQAFSDDPIAQYEILRDKLHSGEQDGMTRIDQSLQDELETADVMGAGQLQNAYNSMAMGGGLSSGARERLQAGSLEERLRARQGQRLQSGRERFELGAQTRQNLFDVGANEAGYRGDLQKQVTEGIGQENIRRIGDAKSAEEQRYALALEKAQRRTQFEADLMKSRSEERVAQTTAGDSGDK